MKLLVVYQELSALSAASSLVTAFFDLAIRDRASKGASRVRGNKTEGGSSHFRDLPVAGRTMDTLNGSIEG